MRHHSQVVRQRPAKPLPPVRVWVVPPFSPVMPKWRNTPLALRGVRYARLRADADNDLKSIGSISPSGGMADAKDLKSFGGNPVPVRVRPWAPSDSLILRGFPLFFVISAIMAEYSASAPWRSLASARSAER